MQIVRAATVQLIRSAVCVGVCAPGSEGLGLGGAVGRGAAGTSAQILHRLVHSFAFVSGHWAVVQGVCVVPGGHSQVGGVRASRSGELTVRIKKIK